MTLRKAIGGVFILLALTGCEEKHFFSNAEQTFSNPSPSATLPPEVVMSQFKPALAVRGINCMLCHAQIHSNIITDFGYGDSQFFVGSKPGTIFGSSSLINDSKPLTLPWYGNYFGTFQLANAINGTLIVPKVTITDSTFMSSIASSYSASSISLKDLMSLDLGSNYYGAAPNSGSGSISSVITPPSGKPRVAEIDQVYIGAPTQSEILALSQDPSSMGAGFEALGSSSISGLNVQAGTGGSYVTNSSPSIACKGDIVIKGTLFLNDVMIDTDSSGCRMMATGSIFVQGRVQYTSLAGDQHLQLSSARAILMGFSPSTLSTRLGSWYRDAQPLTRAAGTNTQKNADIIAEANVIGSRLHDTNDSASCAGTMVTYVGSNGGSQQTLTQCSIHYQRLLLNAPNIQSRYVGRFTGVSIAEIALFAPGALDFEYDSVFDSVPILPKLKPVIHGVCKDPAGTGCNGL